MWNFRVDVLKPNKSVKTSAAWVNSVLEAQRATNTSKKLRNGFASVKHTVSTKKLFWRSSMLSIMKKGRSERVLKFSPAPHSYIRSHYVVTDYSNLPAFSLQSKTFREKFWAWKSSGRLLQQIYGNLGWELVRIVRIRHVRGVFTAVYLQWKQFVF